MTVTEEIRTLTIERASADEIAEVGGRARACAACARTGSRRSGRAVTSIDEIARVTGIGAERRLDATAQGLAAIRPIGARDELRLR